MRRHAFALTVAAAAVAAGCYDVSNPHQELLVVAPILDSMFVGETRPARSVFLIDAGGNQRDPGPVTWTIRPDTVATINAVTGEIAGLGKGAALVIAHAAGDSSPALVIVSRTLDMTLLMDTVYLMPNDTFTIPVAIQKKDPLAQDTVWFDESPSPAIDTITTATGKVWAISTGGPVKYRAHVTTAGSIDTLSDSGAVVVMSPPDTIGSGGFFTTIVGTAIRHNSGFARAMNYNRPGGLAFRLTDSLYNTSFDEKMYLTLPNPVLSRGTFDIDSLNPQEVTTCTAGPFNNPPRPWALWQSIWPSGIQAFSHVTEGNVRAGKLVITQYAPLPGGGAAISGRYEFTAQRSDLYFDPLGALTIRGTFVAPLVQRNAICSQ